jgi:hypothetical protein
MNKPTQEEPFNYLGCIIGLFILFWIFVFIDNAIDFYSMDIPAPKKIR